MAPKASEASVGLLGRAVVGERPGAHTGTRQVDPGHGGLPGPDEGPCCLGSPSRLLRGAKAWSLIVSVLENGSLPTLPSPCCGSHCSCRVLPQSSGEMLRIPEA